MSIDIDLDQPKISWTTFPGIFKTLLLSRAVCIEVGRFGLAINRIENMRRFFSKLGMFVKEFSS